MTPTARRAAAQRRKRLIAAAVRERARREGETRHVWRDRAAAIRPAEADTSAA